MIESFVLGLSSGSACLLTCGMAMFPYLMSDGSGVRKIAGDITIFLFTRLLVYMILAVLVFWLGQAFLKTRITGNMIPGILYIIFAVMLVWYSIRRNREKHCPARLTSIVSRRRIIPLLLGLVNSIGFCPALYILLTRGATETSLTGSLLSFLAFFTGTALWFLPVPLAGLMKRRAVLETIGVLATGLAGIIFMIKGISNLIGGILYG